MGVHDVSFLSLQGSTKFHFYLYKLDPEIEIGLDSKKLKIYRLRKHSPQNVYSIPETGNVEILTGSIMR